ncbi:beta-lactamase family protein [Paenibacillus sp. TRM 82003]|uniref:serine hydrolase domain-containing protein n=1 Tax=Kineococcus sp. TRM81007 TaxID=2925831 RepID=UPI001F5AD65F|nr:serine hydrolase domain-containing protein [Kineococcus sp. TRM81007]MCI2239944.1 beta-lactamase family protein [Kineococcus sp. TRM81007]MCI3925751.1 beta-lactamase family protein [Paenibacillus sp. TRM 82003]
MTQTPSRTARTSHRRRAAAVLTCAALLTAPALSAAAAPPVTAHARVVDRGVDRAVAQRALDELAATGAQGAQARITDGRHRAVLTSGSAHHERSTPVPRNGRFRAGSITKTFVATVVLQLVAEGGVGLDEPVSRYLPGLLPDGDRITVRMLLQHTSGLANYTELIPTDPQAVPTPAAYEQVRYQHHEARDLIALATDRPLDFEPGTSWSYSNTGYLVLGLLVEEVTGEPYARAVERRVLDPLGLRRTSLPGDRVALPPPHAHGYARIGGQVVNVTRLNPSVAGAAGELVSTTADLDRFLDALLDGRLLPPELLAEMKRTTEVSPAYGLGLTVAPLACGDTVTTVYGHDGGIPGYLSTALSTEDTGRRLVVSLTTAPDPGEFRGQAELLAEAFCG